MTTLNSRTARLVLPNRKKVSNICTAQIAKVKSAAVPKYHIPVARPTAIARKILPISRAVPATERKRTRPNVPATAKSGDPVRSKHHCRLQHAVKVPYPLDFLQDLRHFPKLQVPAQVLHCRFVGHLNPSFINDTVIFLF